MAVSYARAGELSVGVQDLGTRGRWWCSGSFGAVVWSCGGRCGFSSCLHLGSDLL